MARKAAAQAKRDALDRLTDPGQIRDVVLLLFWKARFTNPSMQVTISQADIDKFRASCQYLGVKPSILIERPAGHPGSPGLPPSQHNPTGLPPKPAEGPRPFVVVGVVNEGTKDLIRTVENDEEHGQMADATRKLRDTIAHAPNLASALLGQAQEGTYSNAMIQEAAEALLAMAKALQQ